LPDLCKRITEIVVRDLGFAECGLWLTQDEGGRLKRIAYTGEATAGFELEFFPRGQGLMGTALQTGEVIYAPDVTKHPRYIAGDPGTRSELVVPLKVPDGILGVINMESESLAAYSERQQRVLIAFSERAALAIENARLFSSLEQAVRRANDLAISAEEASRLKSQFLTNTSHELRTPLTNIIGSLDIVLNELCSSKAEEQQFLKLAIGAAQELTQIVDDLLEIAKIESGAIDLQTQVTLVAPILEEAFSLNRTRALEKNLALQVRGPAATTLIYADPDKLRRILHNLVGNAVKFTNEGSVTVTVTTDLTKNQMIIQVADTGIGIPTEAQTQLFQPFVQVDGSTTRRYGGTGLGLTISRRLAEMMRGTLSLVSEGQGQGTRLTLTLPLAELEPDERLNAGSN
jgi:signal transduction histidine kinase